MAPKVGVAPGGVEPPHADSKSAALSTELRGRFGQSSAGVDTESAAQRWRETWARGWREKDVDALKRQLEAERQKLRQQQQNRGAWVLPPQAFQGQLKDTVPKDSDAARDGALGSMEAGQENAAPAVDLV